MHHKFVIVDRRLLATGSMNWTYSAVRKNYENLVVSGDPDVVNRFREEYERIWDRLLPEPPAGGGHP
jgi:cardiolipin hydrolase